MKTTQRPSAFKNTQVVHLPEKAQPERDRSHHQMLREIHYILKMMQTIRQRLKRINSCHWNKVSKSN